MARIEFVTGLRREGACGTWGAILLGDGTLCAAMKLPVPPTDRPTIDRVFGVTRAVMSAGIDGIAPIADVAVGGNQVWAFVGIAPGPSIADLLYEIALAPTDLALIAIDAGRTLARLHDKGLWHGSFGADTIVASRHGTIHLTEAGLGPALDGIEMRVSKRPPATEGDDGDPDSATVVIDTKTAVGIQTDVEAWANAVRLFASHLRSAHADEAADAMAACARVATDEGLVEALDRLDEAARGFDGFPERSGLASVMERYDVEDEPDTASVLRAIDALFEAGGPPTPPPAAKAPPSRGFRLPLGRGNSSTPPAPPETPADDNGSLPRRVPAPSGVAERSMATTALAEDETARPEAAGAPPHSPRKTSVIPPRVPRSTGTTQAKAPGALWTPTSPPKESTNESTKAPSVRPALSVDAPAKPDNTVRVGRGVPASNGPRPTPARLGRPAWWPRVALNGALVIVIILGVAGYIWWRADRPLHVMSVSVTVQKHFAAACQLDADVVGTVITRGGTGTVKYQWQRSDGTTTDIYTAQVKDPAKPVEVHLQWTFDGAGEETAQVALVVLAPEKRSASTSFEYICAG